MNPEMTKGIHLSGVSRSFGEIRAVDSLTIDVPRGSVAVLLGPNGAGKTTTVRLITGSLKPNAGTIGVLGMDPAVDGDEIRRRSGVVPPKPALYDRLTGQDNLEYAAKIWDADPSTIKSAAGRFGIDHALHMKVAGYSTGMRTRLALARAVLHNPEILLLDEPTAGLDPESARAVLDLIRELAGSGRTVIMATHLLHEAEGIADQVILMGAGQARAAGHPTDLAARYMKDPVVIVDAENRDLLKDLERYDGVKGSVWNGALHVTLDSIEILPDMVAGLVADGVRLTRVEPMAATLEHLYFEMQRQLREANPGAIPPPEVPA
ncbi:MAG: ABC transporter ATP-binding protein [Acidimicrobiia bacterium]|nr:ABC transporter ATP-binding protein [Acidimicrobiia bacterium]